MIMAYPYPERSDPATEARRLEEERAREEEARRQAEQGK